MRRFAPWTKIYLGLVFVNAISGCTVKAVGDPNRPITINAHVVIDIKGLEKTANNIEDFVSGEKSDDSLNRKSEGTK